MKKHYLTTLLDCAQNKTINLFNLDIYLDNYNQEAGEYETLAFYYPCGNLCSSYNFSTILENNFNGITIINDLSITTTHLQKMIGGLFLIYINDYITLNKFCEDFNLNPTTMHNLFESYKTSLNT